MGNEISIPPGARVRVTFEGTYRRTDDLSGSLLIDPPGRTLADPGSWVPASATIELLPPPIPDEPTGLGAVVRIDGTVWVRADVDGELWRNSEVDWQYWSEAIAGARSVEVLSPGIKVAR